MKLKHVLRNNKYGSMVIGKCQFPFCCNFFQAEHTVRKYCRSHGRIPDGQKAYIIMKNKQFINGFVVTTKTTIRKMRSDEK